MRRTLQLLAAIGVICAPVVGAHASCPAPFSAEYRVKIRGLSGELELSLADEGEECNASSRLQARGLASIFFRGEIDERVSFRIEDGRLLPQHYEAVDSLSGDGERAVIDFDWPERVASETMDGTTRTYDLKDGTVDRLSLQFALMLALEEGRREQTLTVLDGEEKPLQLVYEDTKVEVPFGKFEAVKVRHQRPGSSRATVLYCARDLGFLPVRIEQYRKGKLHVRAELVSLSGT